MSLFDTIDGCFMNFAYDWAFARPVRKVYYNLTITGLSVFVAVFIGATELLGLLAKDTSLNGSFWSFMANFNINTAGFIVVGVFVLTWAVALGIWRLAASSRSGRPARPAAGTSQPLGQPRFSRPGSHRCGAASGAGPRRHRNLLVCGAGPMGEPARLHLTPTTTAHPPMTTPPDNIFFLLITSPQQVLPTTATNEGRPECPPSFTYGRRPAHIPHISPTAPRPGAHPLPPTRRRPCTLPISTSRR